MKRKFIDFHTHFFPENFQRAIYDWFETYGWGIHHRFTFEESISYLKSSGYEKWVVAVYAHKKGVADFLNRWVGEAGKKYGEIIPFGTVHPEDEDPEKVVERAFKDYGVKGIKFHTHVAGFPPEDERLFPAYEKILKYNGLLLLHASHHPTDAGLLKNYDPGKLSGAEHVEPLLIKFPGLKIIVAHLGMGEYDRFASLMDLYPDLYLDTTMVHCMDRVKIKHPETPPPPPDSFMEKYADRILLGSDFPFIPYPVEEQIRCIEKLNISDEAKEKILYRNGRRMVR